MQGDELVAADAGAAVGQGADGGGGQVERAGALVDDDEVVAGAVGLGERDHGLAAYRPGSTARVADG